MAFCSNCGTQLSDGAKFCPKCGTPTERTQKASQFDQDNPCDDAEKGIFQYKYTCITVLCFIAFVFLFLWALAHDSDDGGGLYTYISGASIIGILVLALLIFLGRLTGSTAIKVTIGIAAYFVIMAINVPTASEELRNERKAQREQTIEQEQETQEEKQAREKKEQADREASEKQVKIDKIAKMAYQKGWDERMKRRDFPNPKTLAEMAYLVRYGVEPTKSGEEERWNIFSENYVKGYEAAWEELKRRMHSEDL